MMRFSKLMAIGPCRTNQNRLVLDVLSATRKLHLYTALTSVSPVIRPKRSVDFLIAKLPAPIEEDLAKGILEAIDMDSYRAEKKAMMAIALPDEDVEIEPVPTSAGGKKPEPELDKLSNIVKAFNDQFGGLFSDPRRMEQRITDEIPTRVSADQAYQNARQNSDRQNARIEHDKALKRVITALFTDDAQLFKQFQDNESFRHWLTDTVFAITYDDQSA